MFLSAPQSSDSRLYARVDNLRLNVCSAAAACIVDLLEVQTLLTMSQSLQKQKRMRASRERQSWKLETRLDFQDEFPLYSLV